MSATIGIPAGGGSENVLGRQRARLVTITGDASYPVGGYAFTGPQFGLRGIAGMIQMGVNTAAFGYIPVWNTQTQSLQIMDPTAGSGSGSRPGVEIAAGTNVSTFVFTVWVISTDD